MHNFAIYLREERSVSTSARMSAPRAARSSSRPSSRSSGSSNHSSLSRIEAFNATTCWRSGIFNCRAKKSANLCIAQPLLLTIYGRCRLTVQPILLQPWFRLFVTCSNCTPPYSDISKGERVYLDEIETGTRLEWSGDGLGISITFFAASAVSPWPNTHSGSGSVSSSPVKNFAAMQPPRHAS